MKKDTFFYRFLSAVLIAGIGWLGFSCSKTTEDGEYARGNEPGEQPVDPQDPEDPMRVEYGTPYARYIVRGTVRTVGTQEPLSGIELKTLINQPGEEVFFHPDFSESTLTDEEGNYMLETMGTQWHSAMEVSDPTGAHQTDTLYVSFESTQFVGGEKWYMGEATKRLDINMQKAETQPE